MEDVLVAVEEEGWGCVWLVGSMGGSSITTVAVAVVVGLDGSFRCSLPCSFSCPFEFVAFGLYGPELVIDARLLLNTFDNPANEIGPVRSLAM